MSKELVAGQKLQTYEIISVLGQGGMSRVYLCEDIVLGRRVALKQLLTEGNDRRSIIRLQQEGQSLARLSHPNIVKILAFFNSDDGDPFLVMELLHGCSLAELLSRNGSLTVSEVIKLAEQMCDALQHAHDEGIVHRDIKPTNIFLCSNKVENAKIIDFGIAKITDNSVNATRTGEFVGSPAYLSPEQAMQKPITERSDQYSLGCVLFECLSGHPPFEDETAMGLILKHIHDEAPRLGKNSFVPPAVAKAIERSLRKDPESRFSSMTEFKNALAGKGATNEKRRYSKSGVLALGALFVSVLGIAVAWSLATFGPALRKPAPVENHTSAVVSAPVVTSTSDSWVVPDLSDSYPDLGKARENALKGEHFIEYTLQSDPMTEDLPLGGFSITRHALEVLTKYKNLKRLHMGDTDIGDGAASYLAKIKSLELLDVSRTQVGDAFVEKVSTLPNLKVLQLVDTKITPRGLASLVRTSTLDNLSVRTNMAIDDSFAETIRNMPGLRALDVCKTSIGDEFVRKISANSNLISLTLCGTQVSQKCFPDLAKLKSLVLLHLDNDEKISDLEPLRNLPLADLSLKGIVLTKNTPIVRQVARYPQLKLLKLSKTALRDSDLLILAKAPQLNSLEVADCVLLTPNGIDAFKKLRPKCRVIQEDPDRKAKYEKAESMFRDLGDGVKVKPHG